jgi:pimeloyl-ACP methyl ester carboxylesterase
MASDVVHRQLSIDGVELHVAEAGAGSLVVLLHGFPELWYSWRHQLPALADAGYRAIAPDLRGYGRSSAPGEIEAYALEAVSGDFIRLLDRLGEDRAVFVGHDWGAAVAWHLALEHSERVTAVAGLSVPFVPRAPAEPISLLRRARGEDFYMVWFQEPGVAERALERDVRRTLTATTAWTAAWAQGDDQPRLPAWLTEEDLTVYVEAFERTGFSGGLNYYRNIDRNWKQSEHLADRRIEQPALFITGSRDPVKQFMPAEAMDGWVTDLRGVIQVEGAGHWVQQERPDEVNDALMNFLGPLDLR